MKKLVLALGIMSSAAMISSCTVDTATNGPEYSGYTVGYGGYNVDDNYGGYSGYVGYGGWASNYYSPGYRYNNSSRGYSGGGYGYYHSGYAGSTAYAGHGGRGGHR